jgi:HlyD family secretion protein
VTAASPLWSAMRSTIRAIVSSSREVIHGLRPYAKSQSWNRQGIERLVAAARRHPQEALGTAGAFGALMLGLAWVVGGAAEAPGTVAEVREGPFAVSIVETGTLQALRSVTYASHIQSNQAKIVALAPEGRMVAQGDLLILFDSAPFEEEIRRTEAQLAEARADLQKAQQDVNLQGIQNTEEISAARLKSERSELELKDVEEGKGKLQEEEARAAVTQAQRELKTAETSLEDLRPMLAEGFITRAELERAEQAVSRGQEDLTLAQRKHESLVTYGRPLELNQARAEAHSSRESLRQLRTAVGHRLTQKHAAVDAARSRIAEASARLELARQQLARTEARADVAGIVVYRDVSFGSERRKPQVGDQVWANQPLLILPDVSKMIVETRIRETDIHELEKNQNVEVRVDAYPDLRLTGRVTLVGTLAQEEKERRGVKFFGVTIEIEQREARLRPGMTARVEIQVEKRERALFVPVDAVFEREGRTVVYVARRRGLVPREVTLGPSNRDFVVISKGLSKGERVSLREPGAPVSEFASPQTP